MLLASPPERHRERALCRRRCLENLIAQVAKTDYASGFGSFATRTTGCPFRPLMLDRTWPISHSTLVPTVPARACSDAPGRKAGHHRKILAADFELYEMARDAIDADRPLGWVGLERRPEREEFHVLCSLALSPGEC